MGEPSESPPVLLLVDIQVGIDRTSGGPRNNPEAEEAVARLLSSWREHAYPVVHVRHDSKDPDSPLQRGQPGFEYKAGFAPLDAEAEFIKRVNGPFTGTEVGPWLRDHGLETLVLCGLVTDHCVSTTAREAENRGFDVFVVKDGTATFGRTLGETVFDAETVHRTALAQLDGEFATVITATQVLESLGPVP